MVQKFIPAFDWLRQYDRSNIGKDFSAGLTVAVMLVPQGMAYAMLAGLPPVMGLYASTFPLIAYALFGSSRQLAVGPAGMKGPVRDLITRAGWDEKFGKRIQYFSVKQALQEIGAMR